MDTSSGPAEAHTPIIITGDRISTLDGGCRESRSELGARTEGKELGLIHTQIHTTDEVIYIQGRPRRVAVRIVQLIFVPQLEVVQQDE